MRNYRLVFSLIALALLIGGLSGCDNRTGFEKGVDKAVDNVKDATNQPGVCIKSHSVLGWLLFLIPREFLTRKGGVLHIRKKLFVFNLTENSDDNFNRIARHTHFVSCGFTSYLASQQILGIRSERYFRCDRADSRCFIADRTPLKKYRVRRRQIECVRSSLPFGAQYHSNKT